MKQKVIVKVIEDPQQGVSRVTGNPWNMRNVVLEWDERRAPDAVIQHRVRATMFGETANQWELANIRVGQTIEADLQFATTTARSGFVYNEVRLLAFIISPQP